MNDSEYHPIWPDSMCLKWPEPKIKPVVAEDGMSAGAISRRIYAGQILLCHYCGDVLTMKNYSRDHVIPRSEGGKSNRENLVPCCRRCNVAKSSMPVDVFKANNKRVQRKRASEQQNY